VRTLKIIREPSVYLVGRQSIDERNVARLLADMGVTWSTDTDVAAQKLVEAAGRLCYMSFGKGRKSHAEYMDHILESAHGSVLEHAVWNFIIAGVSRSFTHELIRHRAGFGYSQLSQRYVDESQADFVEPECIAADPELHTVFEEAIRQSHAAYVRLVEGLQRKYKDVEDATLRRKLARQAARSVLPNATETKIFVTANARALRHFIELRGSRHAEVEIRKLAVAVLRIMQVEAPNIFRDYRLEPLGDGTCEAVTDHRKV
jgi:thymidylate synthase (FAD)